MYRAVINRVLSEDAPISCNDVVLGLCVKRGGTGGDANYRPIGLLICFSKSSNRVVIFCFSKQFYGTNKAFYQL